MKITPHAILLKLTASGMVAMMLATGCEQSGQAQADHQAFTAELEEALAPHPQDVTAFYRQRDFEPLWLETDAGWFRGTQWSERTRALTTAIGEVSTHGLPIERYTPAALRQRLSSDVPETAQERASAESALTRRYLMLAGDLARGRFDQDTQATAWHIARPSFSARAALDALVQDGLEHALAAMAPVSDDYARLRQARPHLQTIIDSGGWPSVEAQGLIQPGDHHPAIPNLRRRLAKAGDMEDITPHGGPASDPTLYDDATVKAFTDFQRRHGITTDGIVGEEARAMLNYTATQRLEQVDANLERLRWLPRELGRDRIMVNIAAHYLDAYRDGKAALGMPVIVGEEQNQTPAFDDRLEYVEINPYWTVPKSIIVKEIVHKIIEDPDYLADRNMVVQTDWPLDSDVIDPATIEWERYDSPDANFPHVLRQAPGSENALGRIKFMFPNQFSIYLHDTPARHLFEKADRTFSHGCIRVAQPMALADLVFAHTPGWDEAKVMETIESGEHTRIDLAAEDRLPIYIYYSTAWVDSDDVLHFRPDRYQRDASLMLALRKDRVPGA